VGFLAPLLEAPFTPLCTHAIARRLLPDLPRRSLRALAGYFGVSVPEHRRVEPHVVGSAAIWRGVVSLLEAQGVDTLEALTAWLQSTRARRASGRATHRLPAAVRLGLPAGPGVYELMAGDGRVLYVGKATSLKARVNQHFRGRRGKAERTLELISQVHRVEVHPTETALEAALLEPDLIKAHDPPYNQVLRSGAAPPVFVALDDVLDQSPERGPRHVLGPLRPAPALALMGALVRWLRGAPAPWPGGWGPAPLRRPPPRLIRAGVARLRAERGPVDALCDLRRLGRRGWPPPAREDDPTPSLDAPPEWTAERVAAALYAATVEGARQLRRAAAMRRLRSVRLAWHRAGDGAERVLTVQWGRVEGSAEGRYDRATCDRLSVLLGEIRRLVREDRLQWMELRGDDGRAGGRRWTSAEVRAWLWGF
jgi:DNA polymerase III subunit epsilon